jgi:hypothetical protein
LDEASISAGFGFKLFASFFFYIYIYNNQGIYQNNHLEGDQSEEEREGICYRT